MTNLKRWLADHHVVGKGPEGPPVSREAVAFSGPLAAADDFRSHVGRRATDGSEQKSKKTSQKIIQKLEAIKDPMKVKPR